MLPADLAALLAADDPRTAAALDLVDAFDDALVDGLGRITPGAAAAITALAETTAASPLGAAAAEAAAKVAVGSVAEEHLLLLAGVRTALLGAVHDSLQARCDTALGRERTPASHPPAAEPEAANLRAGARSWLTQLAVAGWRGVDDGLASASGQAVEALLERPGTRRLGVLIDGFAAELRACAPVAAMPRVPLRRWADLWARAMIGTSEARTAEQTPVSGRLLILGTDVHEHPTAVQVQVHAILETDGAPARIVRASVAAGKTDTVVGPGQWRLLDAHPQLLTALAERRTLTLTEMPLRDTGDLIWDDARARAGEPADPFATARLHLAEAAAASAHALDRHPAVLAEPVFIEGYKAKKKDGRITFHLGDEALPVDTARLGSWGPLTPQLVGASTACIGLLRWDGGWSVQPLGVRAPVKKQPTDLHTGDWANGPADPKGAKAAVAGVEAVSVLRERAGRLLRS